MTGAKRAIPLIFAFAACATPPRVAEVPHLAARVQGASLVDGRGAPLVLHGVSLSGAEYACVQGRGIFDGPVDDAMIDGIVSWGANVVRLPLNEDCWLAIRGVPPAYAGDAYVEAIRGLVRRLHAHGLYVILDLHWTAAGTARATSLAPMPDREHAPAFWRSVAGTFAEDPAVLFDLFNEPFPSPATTRADLWRCWRDGCRMDDASGGWDAAGMQSLVDAVRASGSTAPILVAGLAYANDLSAWRAYAPHDPARALVASFHVYDFNPCRTEACWDGTVAPLLDGVPVVTTEIGEADCAHAFVDRYMGWADAHGVSYLAWTWNPFDGASATSCGETKIALIGDWRGAPTPYGVGVRDHFRARASLAR